MEKLYIDTKRYQIKKTGFFEWSVVLEDCILACGNHWSMKRLCAYLNGAYMVGMSDACVQLGCSPEFIKGIE
jgi:hypothetical protein